MKAVVKLQKHRVGNCDHYFVTVPKIWAREHFPCMLEMELEKNSIVVKVKK